MHAKSDSEVSQITSTINGPSSPLGPLYYVQSPSNHDAAEKMSYGSSPLGSPPHYHCSPIHHSRESSTSRYSASLFKNTTTTRNVGNNNVYAWKKIDGRIDEDDNGDNDDVIDEYKRGGGGREKMKRIYVVCFVLLFVVLFTTFSLILWGASKAHKPQITMKSILFESFNIQAGMDHSGVPTDMMTLKSTVTFLYRNPATFFAVHVSSTGLELRSYQLRVASGNMKKFYQKRKSQSKIVAVVEGKQVPLYGGLSLHRTTIDNPDSVSVPLNLTFIVRSRAYVLGKLVMPKFYKHVRCFIVLKDNHLGKSIDLKDSCVYTS
ncbi:hypothetical protein GIB67_007052 [Kingdonia uniflora]|uniref:Late embryogenesis abundant protein LEA-2 subgroup domain-containing protein n=1 Tax=Kingdonia uniflora TaxID=39325 RepID=A0A7J7NZB9_9MAGN|nr:hypothetical protein GIB67_007052 [Kingdonia uniflora]